MITVTRGGFSRKDLTSIPNVLTYLRIATIPVILVVLTPPASQESLNMACALFVAASITDYLDGILARRHNQVTSIGKLLDPLADKLLTSAVMVMLIPLGKIPAWLVFIIIGRDTTITGLRSIAASQGLIIDASRMGKNKMISQARHRRDGLHLDFSCLELLVGTRLLPPVLSAGQTTRSPE